MEGRRCSAGGPTDKGCGRGPRLSAPRGKGVDMGTRSSGKMASPRLATAIGEARTQGSRETGLVRPGGNTFVRIK